MMLCDLLMPSYIIRCHSGGDLSQYDANSITCSFNHNGNDTKLRNDESWQREENKHEYMINENQLETMQKKIAK